MLYAVIFEDDPTADPEIRPRHMEAHLRFLEENGIRDAGPLIEGGEATGGIWLLDAEGPAAVEALVKADPFWPTGLRAGVRIAHWRKVWSNGARA